MMFPGTWYFTSPEGSPLADYAVAVEAMDEWEAFSIAGDIVPPHSLGGRFYRNPAHKSMTGKTIIEPAEARRIIEQAEVKP